MLRLLGDASKYCDRIAKTVDPEQAGSTLFFSGKYNIQGKYRDVIAESLKHLTTVLKVNSVVTKYPSGKVKASKR